MEVSLSWITLGAPGIKGREHQEENETLAKEVHIDSSHICRNLKYTFLRQEGQSLVTQEVLIPEEYF